ncbi:MAG: EscU/YscU/HrcU family type III secretion system export apparatus switch protein [Novosphingobium sp.]|nr:EscU/YscU/HrcU family type III secretion system export apparatus switch protein [Novosphingobium sp.]
MSDNEQSGEKTFAPTDKRKRDAAQNGDVLRSRELATAAAVLVGAAWLMAAGPWMLGALIQSLRAAFIWDQATIANFAPGQAMQMALWTVLPPVVLLGGAVITSSLVSQMGFGTGLWVGKNLAPKASRLNPLSGLKRMFGPNGLIEMAKGITKVILLGAIAFVWARANAGILFAMGRGNLAEKLDIGWNALITLLFALGAGLVIIAMIDVPVQWMRRMKRLKMSHKDMRDEQKDTDGSPERKAAMRDRQRKLAMGALAPAMREAQFVITNPTHFSVALAYDPAKAHAPIVLAKGRGEKALAMRELAADLALPVLEYPTLARSVYFTTRERQVIREELYIAVAAVLAFVLSLKRGENPPPPHIAVPTQLCFDVNGCPDPGAAN